MKMTMTMTNDSDMIMKCHQKIAMTMAMTNDSEIIVKCHQKIPMTVTPSFPWQAMHTHFFFRDAQSSWSAFPFLS